MARYRGPSCKLCRREGVKLFLKGERCMKPSCAFERRGYAPGQHGQRIQRKVSDYGQQLREKQKAKRIYGMLEQQFELYFRRAEREKGVSGENLLRLLERRLDNIVYRFGFASSRAQARQLVRHGHFEVNGRKTNIPSFLVKPGDQVTVRAKSRDSAHFKNLTEEMEHHFLPEWLSVDLETLSGRVLALPTRDQIEVQLNEHLVIEYYSR